MEKKRKLSTKIAALLLLLTVISCCFLGSTFAKYTSSTTGTATTGVALWKITGVSENGTKQEFDFSVSKISPDHDGDTNEATLTATHYTIQNLSEVDANVTVAVGTNWEYTFIADSGKSAIGDIEYKASTPLTDEIMNQVFTVTLSCTNTGSGGTNVTSGIVLKPNDQITLELKVTWKTQGTDGDAIDTAIGMYVESITKSLTITATQASTVNS